MGEWTTDAYLKVMADDVIALEATWRDLMESPPAQRRYHLGQFFLYLGKLEANAKLLQAAMIRIETEERQDKLPFVKP